MYIYFVVKANTVLSKTALVMACKKSRIEHMLQEVIVRGAGASFSKEIMANVYDNVRVVSLTGDGQVKSQSDTPLRAEFTWERCKGEINILNGKYNCLLLR